MGVKLSDFLRKMVVETGAFRPERGDSVVPIAIVEFSKNFDPVLITMNRRNGRTFYNTDLNKKYSACNFCWDMNMDYTLVADIIKIDAGVVHKVYRIPGIPIILVEGKSDWSDYYRQYQEGE